MAMNIKPLHDRVIIRRIEEGEQVRGGIIIPDTAKEKPQEGEVIAVGSGKVLENGMPRFFRRLAEGVFDEQDVIKRAHELAEFIVEAGKTYKQAKPVAVGFSNGANIAAAILLLRPEVLSGAILLRAMVPLAKPPQADLAQKPVLIISGASDPIIPASNAALLAAMLKNAHADVQHETLPTGHNLTQNDVTLASTWLNR